MRGYQKAATAYHKAFNHKDASGNIVPGENYDEMIGIMAKTMQQPAAVIAAGMPYVDPMGRLLVDDVYNQVDFWQKLGLVDKSLRAKDVLDLSFVNGHFNVPK